MEIPDRSHSQPVIWGDKLFVLTANNNGRSRSILCINKNNGETLWSKRSSLQSHKIHKFNSYASGSPTVDKDRVYASVGDTGQYLLKAWSHDGKELWTANLGPFESQHGHALSPMLYKGRVIIANDQLGESFIVALNARTGKQVWKNKRRTGTRSWKVCSISSDVP